MAGFRGRFPGAFPGKGKPQEGLATGDRHKGLQKKPCKKEQLLGWLAPKEMEVHRTSVHQQCVLHGFARTVT